MKFIRQIDIFDKEVKFSIDKESTYKTFIGGLLTIFVILSSLALLWYFGKDIYERAQPYQNNFYKFLNNYPYYQINETNFELGISVYDSNDDKIDDPRYFSYIADIKNVKYDSNTDKTNLKFTPQSIIRCKDKTLDPKYYTPADVSLLSESYCSEFDTLMGGNEDLNTGANLPRVAMIRCNKEDEIKYDFQCYTDQEIESKFGLYVTVYLIYQTDYYRPNDIYNPIIKKFEQKEFFIRSTKTSYKSYFTYSTAKLYTDKGLLFDDDQESGIPFFQLHTFELFDISNLGDYLPDNTMVGINFWLSRIENSYSRKYLKLPDALANVGGIISIALPVIQFLLSFYLDNEYFVHLYRLLLKLEVEKETNDFQDVMHRVNETPKENFSFVNNNNYCNNKKNSSNIELITDDINNPQSKRKQSKFLKVQKENIFNKDLKHLINYKDKKREEITITSKERFCFLNCCCFTYNRKNRTKNNLRYELINLAEKELNKKLDIVELCKNFNQFRLLKKLLLNKNQCYLLENRELNSLTIVKSIPNEEIEDLNEYYEKKRFNLLVEYLKLKKFDENISNIDKLLIKYLNYDLRDKLKKEFSNLFPN